MRKKLPAIVFSEWKHWRERATHNLVDQPGVYVVAHFEKAPKGFADPQCQEVIYIGETCANSLKGRWQQFNRSAFESKFGHSGGAAYAEKFGDDGAKLYVAALPLGHVAQTLQALYIRYIERKLIFEYALKWGKPPICNRK